MSSWEENKKKHEANKALVTKHTRAFKKARKNHINTILFFWSIKNKPEYHQKTLAKPVKKSKNIGWGNNLMSSMPSRESKPKFLESYYKDGMALEKDLLEACKNNEYEKASVLADKKSHKTVEATCNIAKNWKTYFQAYMSFQLKKEERRILGRMSDTLKTLEGKAILYQQDIELFKDPKAYHEKMKNRYSKLYKNTGKEVPNDLFAGILTISKEFSYAIKKAMKKNRWKKIKTYRNKSAAKALKNELKENKDKRKLKRAGLIHRKWEIIKNEFGIPKSKVKGGKMLVKIKGEKFCRIYHFTAKREYAGAGKYENISVIIDKLEDKFIISRCR